MFLREGVLIICSKFTGEHPCRSLISIKLLCNFIEITVRHGCSVNFLHIFRTPTLNKSEGLLLIVIAVTITAIPYDNNTNDNNIILLIKIGEIKKYIVSLQFIFIIKQGSFITKWNNFHYYKRGQVLQKGEANFVTELEWYHQVEFSNN